MPPSPDPFHVGGGTEEIRGWKPLLQYRGALTSSLVLTSTAAPLWPHVWGDMACSPASCIPEPIFLMEAIRVRILRPVNYMSSRNKYCFHPIYIPIRRVVYEIHTAVLARHGGTDGPQPVR